MISIKNVSKSFSSKSPLAVDDVTLEIKDGEILGLVGLNGAGKTTTIRMASGIILPTKGTIEIDGHDIVKDKVKASSLVGWIPEFPNFEPNAKPVPLMRYFAGFYGMKRQDSDRIIKDLLDKVGLTPYLNRKLRTYSQGMKKRYSMAETLIGDPKNILFDETLNGLDPEGVMFVRNLMLKLKKEGKAILLSSHILSEVENIADKVAIISHGKLIKLLNKGELKTLGKETIRIMIDNIDENIAKVLSDYGEVSVSGNRVVISKLKIKRDQYSEIPTALISNRYMISGFESSGVNLEEYFFDLIGEHS